MSSLASMGSGTVATFAAVYLQAISIALLAAGTGRFLHRSLVAKSSAALPRDNSALAWSRGFFLGMGAFLVVFVVLSRLVGARAALWAGLAAMAAACALEFAAWRRDAPGAKAAWRMIGALVLLVAAYSVVNTALWLQWGLSRPEGSLLNHLLTNLGSIHTGRYANYALFIVEHDRVPWLAQNAAQSILASLHLMLGTWSPLVALMAWIPVSMAFLTTLVFGLFRSGGFAAAPCAAAAFMVMFCNVAVSAVHVMVFDNGSPLAFIGYTDLILSVGAFLVLGEWLRDDLTGEERRRGTLAVPALFGATWCWHAPQNLVIAVAAGAAVAIAWLRWYRQPGMARRLATAGAAFALGIGVGLPQLGTMLPAPLREDTGLWTQEVDTGLAVRPYIQYLRHHWTHRQWSIESHGNARPYESTYERSIRRGPDEVYRGFAWLVEAHAWDSLRIYGFPLLGLLLLGWALRRTGPDPGMRAWLAFSAASFGVGYLIAFMFDLGHMKWWLTRFLVPGTAMALTCLGFAALMASRNPSPWAPVRRLALPAVVVAATLGPMIELATVAYRNFAAGDSIAQRLATIARHRSYFIFDEVESNPAIARKDPARRIAVAEGAGRGVAMSTRPQPLGAGTHYAAFRISTSSSPPPESPLVELDVVADGGKRTIARRLVRVRELQADDGGTWAALDFHLPHVVRDASVRLSNASDQALVVSDVRLEPR